MKNNKENNDENINTSNDISLGTNTYSELD